MQASPGWPPQGLGLRRWTIGVLACVAAVVAGAHIAQQPYLIFAVTLALVYVGTLAVNAPVLAWLIIALQPAALIVPFFPGRPFFWELCSLLAWPSLVAYALMNREKLVEMKFDSVERKALFALVGYLAVIVFLMMYRGVGFRVFGGSQMGGRFYVQQVVLAIVPLLLMTAETSRKCLISAVATGWVLSLTYLIADFAFSMGGGVMSRVLYFVEIPSDAINFELGYEITGMRRYQSLLYVAASGLACLWTLVPLKDLFGKQLVWAGPLMMGLFGLGLMSGHRALFVLAASTLFLITLFQNFWTPLRISVGLLLLCAGLGLLYVFADRLPMSAQRSVSFLPGIRVTPLAERDATDTIDDRIGILKLAVRDVPRYLVIGRGFGMERLDLLSREDLNDNVAIGYANGIFYNGTLGLLLKTGFVGLLFTSLFMWWVSRIAWEVVSHVRRNGCGEKTIYDRLCLLICAQWFSAAGVFYFTHGDASLWTQLFILKAALIIVCRRHQLSSLVGDQELVFVGKATS